MKKFLAALGIAGAFALSALGVGTAGTASPATTTLGACNPGWYVNDDEEGRKPTPGPQGMKFEGDQLIHHAVGPFPVAQLAPGTFTASPAPDQPSFFSVEVRNPSGAYGTLRWNPSASKWSITIGAGKTPAGVNATDGTFEHSNPALLLAGKVTKWGAFAPGSNEVVSFGIGYTANPKGKVATTVATVRFRGTTYDLKCVPASSSTPPTATPTSAQPTTSTSGTGGPIITSDSLPLTGSGIVPWAAGTGVLLALAGAALLVWVRRRARVEFES